VNILLFFSIISDMNRVKLLDYEIDTYGFNEALYCATELMCADKVSQVVTINPEMFDIAAKDEEFATILKEAEMVVADGIGIKIGLKILGENIERVTGIDFSRRMLEIATTRKMPIALIGAKPEIIDAAKSNLEEEIENLNIVYSHDGYFSDVDVIIKELKESKPKLVLVALGAPKQEKFIYKAKTCLDPCLMIGVGGSFDVWAGAVDRAPKIYQKLGLEWLYRTVKQPERFKRIFPSLPLFVLKVLRYRMEEMYDNFRRN